MRQGKRTWGIGDFRLCVNEFKHSFGAGKGVLQLGDHAGYFIERLGILVCVAQECGKLAYSNGTAHRRKRTGHADSGIYQRIDEPRAGVRQGGIEGCLAGNIGQAIAGYTDFEKRGFKVKRIFDINPALFGQTIRGILIDDVANLEDYIKDNHITIAALTLPKNQAVTMANNLVKWGIKGIWNFAPIDLRLPSNVKVETVHLSDSLMRLSYNIREMEEDKDV
jgi:hypothetical protein